MPNPIDVGTGITIAFGTSGFAPYILSLDGIGYARDVVETTHLGTTGGKEFRPGDLYDAGELTMTVAHDPSISPPMLAVQQAEVVTVTWPIPSGLTTGATWVCNGFMSNYQATGPLEDKMTASVTVKLSGDSAITAAA